MVNEIIRDLERYDILKLEADRLSEMLENRRQVIEVYRMKDAERGALLRMAQDEAAWYKSRNAEMEAAIEEEKRKRKWAIAGSGVVIGLLVGILVVN